MQESHYFLSHLMQRPSECPQHTQGNTGQSLAKIGRRQQGLLLLEAAGVQSLARFAEGSSLCRKQDCAEVPTNYGCSRVGNPGVQNLSQFLREKSRTSRKGKLLHISLLAPSLQQPALATQRTAQKWVDSGHILPRRLTVPQKAQMVQLS